MVLQAPALLALARIVAPGSSLLPDCCKRVPAVEFNEQKWTHFDVAHAKVVASKCLAAHYSEDVSAFAAIVAASDNLRGYGGAVVGLASRWPDHEIVVREYRNPAGVTPRRNAYLCRSLPSQRTRDTRIGCDLPCQVRNEARPQSMGFPRGCVGRIPGASGKLPRLKKPFDSSPSTMMSQVFARRPSGCWLPRRQGKATNYPSSCWPRNVDVRDHRGSRWTFSPIASVRLTISCPRCWETDG